MTFSTMIGAARVDQVTELDAWPFPPSGLYPDIDEATAAGALDALGDHHVDATSGDLRLAIHTYVVRLGDLVVVVDTGNGNHKERPNLLPHHRFDTDFLGRLSAAGVDAAEVDLVISTHLHPDHCGWNTQLIDGTWRPTFARATHVFSRTELDALRSLAERDDLEGVEADLARTFEDSVRPVLDTGHWRVARDGEVLAEHEGTRVVVRAAPGHTAGHLVVEVLSDTGGAVISGDVIHHPIQALHPGLCQGGDADAGQARATRDALLRRCADEGLLLLTAHVAVDAPLRVWLDADARPRLTVGDPAEVVA